MPNNSLLPIFMELLGWIFSTIVLSISALAAIHVAQHVERPEHKLVWILLFAFLPIIGSVLYYFTKYARFKQIGKGSLIYKQGLAGADFFKLSKAEMAGGIISDNKSILSRQSMDDY